MNPFAQSHAVVPLCADLKRILALPRRTWTEQDAEQLADELTEILRTPNGTMRLRPVQAVALYEIGKTGGAVLPLPVGQGKTLVSALAAVMLDAKRPMLLLLAELIEKTKRELKALREHWEFPKPYLCSYQWLGRVQAKEFLNEYQPDLIFPDEAHRLKNGRAAVTKVVKRFMQANPTVPLIPASGTLTKRSVKDYGHLAAWSLGEGSPLPLRRESLELWSDALDERKPFERKAHPGALVALCNIEEKEFWQTGAREAARSGFRRRFRETPGVITAEGGGVDCSIVITTVDPPACPAIDDAFARLRSEWELPDGQPLADGAAVWRHARELALGFYYRWDPEPPRAWLEARRVWSAYCREVLARSRTLDSELQVKLANPDSPELQRWEAVRDTFTPNTVAVWISETVLELCAKWLQDNGGILWVEHVQFGQRLSELTGVPYYRAKGFDAAGNFIEDHKHGTAMIAGIESNHRGRNLQHGWSVNFIVSPPPDGERIEQLLGRTHRPGQEADEVHAHWAAFCREHVDAYWKARGQSEYVRSTMGDEQKILLADYSGPSLEEIGKRVGARWKENR